jgi:hypothetical protein
LSEKRHRFVCLFASFAKTSFGLGVQREARGLRKDGPLMGEVQCCETATCPYLQHVETSGNDFAQTTTDQYLMNIQSTMAGPLDVLQQGGKRSCGISDSADTVRTPRTVMAF